MTSSREESASSRYFFEKLHVKRIYDLFCE